MHKKDRFKVTIPIKWDRTSLYLVAVNFAAIYFAIAHNWSFGTLVWVYWVQSIIIGFFTELRLIKMKKYFATIFFPFHYGAFHAAYYLFLIKDANFVYSHGVAIMVGLFLLNHLLSYHFYFKKEAHRFGDEGEIMGYAYLRIVPMHLIIVMFSELGGASPEALVVFLLLKTGADLIAHYQQHA